MIGMRKPVEVAIPLQAKPADSARQIGGELDLGAVPAGDVTDAQGGAVTRPTGGPPAPPGAPQPPALPAATADDGFMDNARRTVSENARTLRFKAHELED